jgi:hypothetical protein
MRPALVPRAASALLAAAVLATAGPARAQEDADRLRNAKALFFDRKYAEARLAWRSVLAASRGSAADAAAYWVARCSENLGELDRAFEEYQAFLDRRPSDQALAEEARTSRVGIAARLYKAGKKRHLPVLQGALSDPSRTVRYYAALQLSALGPEAGRPAVPVLKKILEEERDQDLVERAKLGLLRIEPEALAGAPTGPGDASGRAASWIRVRVRKPGQSRPAVSVNLPVALAELVFKSLPEEARRELRAKGYDADNFWDRLKKLGRTEILTIEGDEGERIEIWIE